MNSKTSPKKSKRERELEAEVKQLKQTVAVLESKTSFTKTLGGIVRKVSIFVFVIICALMLNFAIIAGWLKQNIINTEVWTDKTSQIMQNPAVQRDVAAQITDELFIATDAQSIVEEVVPPRASALAVPLTNSLKSYTQEQVQKIIASDKFQNYWREINANAHAGIIASLENGGKTPENNSYVIYINNEELLLNLKPIVQQIQTELSSRGLSFVSGINTNNITRTIPLAQIESMSSILVAFNALNKAFPVLIIVGLLSGVLALVLAKDKRMVLIGLSATTIGLMVLNVQAIYLARFPAVEQLASSLAVSSRESAEAVLGILTDDLVTYNRALMAIASIVLVTAIMSGSSKFATYIRTKIASLTASKNNSKLMANLADNAVTYVSILAGLYALLIVLRPVKGITVPIITLVGISLVSIWLLSLRTVRK